MRLALSSPPPRQISRNVLIAGAVVVLHGAAIWALQTGLLQRAIEVVVPVALLSEMVAPPSPKVEPPQPAPPLPAPVKPAPVRKSPPAPRPQPTPLALPEAPGPSPAPAVSAPVLAAPAPAAPTAPAPPAPPAAPPKIQLPSTLASFRDDCKPPYPSISKRLGEQGKVMVRVFIGEDGMPKKAELKSSSGFERLDQLSLAAIMKCRFAPGKVGNVPEAMWYEAPFLFGLD